MSRAACPSDSVRQRRFNVSLSFVTKDSQIPEEKDTVGSKPEDEDTARSQRSSEVTIRGQEQSGQHHRTVDGQEQERETNTCYFSVI